MGLKDTILDTVAKWFSPSMDHPAGGGMTGDDEDGDYDFAETETDEGAGSAPTDDAGEDGATAESDEGA